MGDLNWIDVVLWIGLQLAAVAVVWVLARTSRPTEVDADAEPEVEICAVCSQPVHVHGAPTAPVSSSEPVELPPWLRAAGTRPAAPETELQTSSR
jgi:hypothetical protein